MTGTPSSPITPTAAGGPSLLAAAVQWQDVGDAEIAYRVVGSGPPLLLLHGYPLNGLTFRNLVPALAQHFTCYVADLPGAGQSRWSRHTDFKFEAQAQGLKTFVDRLGLTSYATLSHDTGGTIARRLAIIDAARTRKIVVIGTEIPHHRPPWIRLFQFRSRLPGAAGSFRSSMASRRFRRSSMGFGGVFADLDYIDSDFFELLVKPMIDSAHQRQGQIHRLRGIDWKVVDSLAEGHRHITAPALLIWGEDDPVFPLAEAQKMALQFKPPATFSIVPGGKTFVHEERPAAVVAASLPFLLS
jgi:haloalkane dehalogenase